jgi:CRISPR/Cas system CSM-associated protein Csm2 small subunit
MNSMLESAKETAATKRSTQTTKTQTRDILTHNRAVQLTSNRELRSLHQVLIISRSGLAATVQRRTMVVQNNVLIMCFDH